MSCDYCDERRGVETVYNKIYGSRNRMVYETNSFVVFPCMGQLREGHLLIASKAHRNSIGMLDADIIRELESLVSDTAAFFWETYQRDMLCFEHGVLDDDGANGGCGIYHMHLHVLPADQEEFSAVLQLVRKEETNFVSQAAGLLDTRHCIANQKTYIFLSLFSQMKKQDHFIITNRNNYFESQYMRKMICKVFGKPDWDWRRIERPEFELISTLEKSYAFFNK